MRSKHSDEQREWSAGTSVDDGGQILWTLRRGRLAAACVLYDRGPHGTEVRFYMNGAFLAGARYPTKALACDWGEARRVRLENEGWRSDHPGQPETTRAH
jgi:hypothetical protein